MASSNNQNVKGLAETMAIFDLLAGDLKEEVLTDALHQAAEITKQAVEVRAPVLTGNLKAKIEVKILPTIKQGTVKGIVIGASIAGHRPKKGEIDRPAYYALQVEKGYMAGVRETRVKADTFKTYTTKSGRTYTRGSAARSASYSKGSVYVAPNPFMQPAFDSVKGKIPLIFEDAFKRRINSKTSQPLMSRDLLHPNESQRGLAH